jgi:protein-L-isoaspartate O-methyltransferase
MLIIPVGDGKEQKMLKIIKDADGKISQEEFGTFKFVPMLERKVR